MTLQQLEQRIQELEQKFENLEKRIPPSPIRRWRNTFGMFADDRDFDEVLRLGREFREQENQQTP